MSTMELVARAYNGLSGASRRKAQIFGGIIGGSFALSFLILVVYFGYMKLTGRRIRQRSTRQQQNEVFDPDEGNERYAEFMHRTKTAEQPVKPFQLLRRPSPIRHMRPLPQEPRESPATPGIRVHIGNPIHHEAPYLSAEEAQHTRFVVPPTFHTFENPFA